MNPTPSRQVKQRASTPVAGSVRLDGGALWMSARARNALRRPLQIGAIGIVVFLLGLIALLIVPLQTRTVRIPPRVRTRVDSLPMIAQRDSARAEAARAMNALTAARTANARVPVAPPVDSMPAPLRERRDSLAEVSAALGRLIARTQDAPLAESYRALAQSRFLAGDAAAAALLDSLELIDRQRDQFGALGGVDPIFVQLTTRMNEIGAQLRAIGESKRAAVRTQLAEIRAQAPPPPPPVELADTVLPAVQRDSAQQRVAALQAEIAHARAVDDSIDKIEESEREAANGPTPPVALLTAALVLGAAIGFGVSLAVEVRRPHVADVAEAERIAGARVLATVGARQETIDRTRRTADVDVPDAIDLASPAYRQLYLHLLPSGAGSRTIALVSDEPLVAAIVAVNVGAAAAYEARGVLLLDLDRETSGIARVLLMHAAVGIGAIADGTATLSDAITMVTIGRDRSMDVVAADAGPALHASRANHLQAELARASHRYELTAVTAPLELLSGPASPVADAEVVLCVRLGHTLLATMAEMVDALRTAGLHVSGLVVWTTDLPPVAPIDVTGQSRADATVAGTT